MPDQKEGPQEAATSTGARQTNDSKPNSTVQKGRQQPLLFGSHPLADLRRSGLSDDTIRQAEIFSVTPAEARQLLHRSQIRSGGYAIPYFDVDGNPMHQKDGQPYVNIKLDIPLRSKKRKLLKYLKPTGEPNAIYLPPGGSPKIQDPHIPLLMTEGEKKALKATQEGFLCIALPGVWGFKTRKGHTAGSSIPLPQLDEIPMSGREIFIAFDSDVSSNLMVQKAEKAFAEYVRNRGAMVYKVRLPEGSDGDKVGLDDFLIQKGAAELTALMEQTRISQESAPKAPSTSQAPTAADIADEFLTSQGLLTAEGLGLRWFREDWYLYNGLIFQPLPLHDLKAQLVGHLRSTSTRAKATQYLTNNILLHLQAICTIPSSISLPARCTESGWVPTSDSLVLSNGILDLQVLLHGQDEPALQPLTPLFVSTVHLPFSFDPMAQCPHWLEFLDEILPDPDSRQLLKELFGYCLTYDTSLQKFFLFEGSGANGKGVVLRILTRLSGETNVSSLPLELFGSAHDLIATLGKLVNITSEIGDLDRVAEGLLKQFTGDDLMHFNPKHRAPFSAKPTAKLIIATNVRPPFRDRSEGVWRRLIILPFPVSVPPDQQNPDLTEMLTAELSGILNWAIAGAFSLRTRRHFVEPVASVEARQQFQREANPARLFLEEYCAHDPVSVVPTVLLYRAYAEFCQASGYRPLNATHFGREVHAKFPSITRVRCQVQGDGARPWGYQGLKLVGAELST